MKKEELKAALHQINPSEALIQKTLLKVREQKQTEKTPVFFRTFTISYRYAAAFCALALVLCLGIAMQRNGIHPTNPDTRMVPEVGSEHNSDLGIASYTLDHAKQDTVEVQGTLQACYLSAVTAEEAADGIIACGTVEILVNKEENSTIRANMYFYDNETLSALIGVISEDIYFILIPEETDGTTTWKVIDFSLETTK